MSSGLREGLKMSIDNGDDAVTKKKTQAATDDRWPSVPNEKMIKGKMITIKWNQLLTYLNNFNLNNLTIIIIVIVDLIFTVKDSTINESTLLIFIFATYYNFLWLSLSLWLPLFI